VGTSIPSSALKMKVICFSETLVPTYKFTRLHNPEDYHGHLHRHENLKSHLVRRYDQPMFTHTTYLQRTGIQIHISAVDMFVLQYRIDKFYQQCCICVVNPLEPDINDKPHLLKKSVTLHFLFRGVQ
jgi:hypothetical protein